jgi:hypothetical protein
MFHVALHLEPVITDDEGHGEFALVDERTDCATVVSIERAADMQLEGVPFVPNGRIRHLSEFQQYL